MDIREYLKDNIVYLDGGMGTLLQKEGLGIGVLPETLNLTHPEAIQKIHRDYFDAGSNVVNTNTFGANLLKFSEDELEEIVAAAMDNARAARDASVGAQNKWIALDIGPTGKMLKPYGDLDFEEAVRIFAATVKLGVKYGADLIFIETMNDSYETKAALLAAKENSSLPVFVSNAYSENGKLMTGAEPHAMVALLEGMGADAIGVNCSLGPRALAGVVSEYLDYASVPVIMKPNAGLPRAVEGKTVFDVLPDEFSTEVARLMSEGVRVVGGCCGTTPEYISALVQKTKGFFPEPITEKNITCISSYTHACQFDKRPILIGERINPTGKKRFKEALRENDINYILNEGLSQEEKGVEVLDVNVGLPEIDEEKMLTRTVCELQAIISLPLQIDTSNAKALESALRRYNGKAMINSVNGKQESMDAVFPLAKKYGGLIVALTLDENGIPDTAEGRLAIAEKILLEAKKHGISKKDIIFDPLALTVSADNNAAKETLRAVKLISEKLGAKTTLGVSNVSFGLPEREIVTASFFTLALGAGLSAAIMNPYSYEMRKSYAAYLALAGLDDGCADYIRFTEETPKPSLPVEEKQPSKSEAEFKSELQKAIVKGLKDNAYGVTAELLKSVAPLDIVQNEIIPALDIVGKGYENKTIYLPSLLMSAEAAKSAFDKIRESVPKSETGGNCTIVIATVEGDIHDIGKNIVKLLLENYGFNTVDLGRDVSVDEIVETTVRLHAPIVGLSALMTTTVPAMEKTIKALREKAPWCKIIVGGAVLTKEYADMIGADMYARDAMEAVRWAEALNA